MNYLEIATSNFHRLSDVNLTNRCQSALMILAQREMLPCLENIATRSGGINIHYNASVYVYVVLNQSKELNHTYTHTRTKARECATEWHINHIHTFKYVTLVL